jgi:protein involved in polysaccharide export with SLBB domain
MALGLSDFVLAQNPEDIIAEAQRRNIDSRDKALNELAKNGISLTQAQEMAQLQGIDFDSYLDNYLSSYAPDDEAVLTPSNQAITEVKIITPTNIEVPDTIPVQTLKADLNYFGYDIFENNPFGQKEYLVGNIDEGYLLAPGDELRITVFGDNNLDYVSKIDLNGNLSLPKLGVFQAAGQSYATLKERLKLFLGKFYSGLLTVPSRTFLDISLTQIRPVKVTLLGQVQTPGPHLVNGLATVLNSLYASGGIKTSGTLREIKVYRGNTLLKTVDLYDYITKGAIDQDIRLANNDIIYVGPRLSSISLNGDVKQQGIYELLPGQGLNNLFTYSGGLPVSSSLSNVNISRITPFEQRDQTQIFDRFLTTININSTENASDKNLALMDGDIVSIQSILEKQLNQVTIQGSIYEPGTYALNRYADLRDLIETGAKGLLPNTFRDKVDIYRQDQQGNLYFKTYNLSAVLSGQTKVTLQENDDVKIYSLAEVEGESKVTISGFVSDPKTIFWRSDLSLFDLIFQATSFEELDFQNEVLAKRIDLKRYDTSTGRFTLKQFSLERLEELKETLLVPKDQIILYTKSVYEDLYPTLSVIGAVNNPGEFALDQNMYIEDAVLSAGGFMEQADKAFVYINRLNRNIEKGTYSKLIEHPLDLDYMIGNKEAPSDPFVLKNHDVISVLIPKDAVLQPRISITGEVQYPRNIIIESNRININDIIDLVGGLTPDASLESSYIIRNERPLFAQIKNEKNIGNIELIDGDQLIIGSLLDPVTTSGNVMNPLAFSYKKGKRVKHYINNSGGRKDKGRKGVIINPNGQTKKIGLFKNPRVLAGSSIVMTFKPEKVKGESGEFVNTFLKIMTVVTTTLTTILLINQI